MREAIPSLPHIFYWRVLEKARTLFFTFNEAVALLVSRPLPRKWKQGVGRHSPEDHIMQNVVDETQSR
jgi:hypothetical protein